MHVMLNGEPSEEVDCFMYLGSEVATDGGCERNVVHRMNQGYDYLSLVEGESHGILLLLLLCGCGLRTNIVLIALEISQHSIANIF